VEKRVLDFAAGQEPVVVIGMPMLRHTSVCRLMLIGCVPLVSIAAVAPPSAADGKCGSGACGAFTTVPISDQEVAMSLVEEINQERAGRQLRGLGADQRLTLAAVRHARDMVRRGYFSHVIPGGRRMTSRVQATGYLRNARSWWLGETLAWGTGDRSTPAAIVAAWMDSAAHRRVLLGRQYREVGIGVALGTPFVSARDDAATYAAELGLIAP